MRKYILNLFTLCTFCIVTAGCEDFLDTTNERDIPAYNELTLMPCVPLQPLYTRPRGITFTKAVTYRLATHAPTMFITTRRPVMTIR